MHKRYNTNPAFTIVELIIVIVIIAILATVIIVAYNGITKRSHESSLKSDLDNASKLLEMHKTLNNIYPQDLSNLKDVNQGQGFKPSGTNLITYHKVSNDKYCIDASFEDNLHYYITNNSEGAVEGTCESSGSLPVNYPHTDMQGFTTDDCTALTTFTGTNNEALVTLRDPRGLEPYQTYTVGKLADGHCWMLDNLKLGSTSGTITLTSADSNVVTNFTLPQLYNGTSSSYVSNDTPYTFGPIPGDTGSGATNYGYLYNWPAATAGETTITKPAGSEAANHDICPKNWRLPVGTATGEYAWLNAKMIDPDASSASYDSSHDNYWRLESSGPFRGILAGYWNAGFINFMPRGFVWTSSVYNSDTDYVFDASFYPSDVSPGNKIDNRSNGVSVRCILK